MSPRQGEKKRKVKGKKEKRKGNGPPPPSLLAREGGTRNRVFRVVLLATNRGRMEKGAVDIFSLYGAINGEE